MNIIDGLGQHTELLSVCLEDWSEEAKEAGSGRREWINRFRKKGLQARLAIDDHGKIGGMIQYLPVEASHVEGTGLYFILCVWVHGYKEGRGNHQGRGMGKALLEAAEKDARERGATGMAAWGVWLPFWMKASWFRKQGYRGADRNGLALLLWKPFCREAVKPAWFKGKKKFPEPTPDTVTVTAFRNGWCMAQNLVVERARKAAAELGDRVIFKIIDTSDPETFRAWGQSDAVYVDHKRIQHGPPPSYTKIRKTIAARLARLP